MYSEHLPRHTHPWLYLALEISPDCVDVNIHPTKHEVHFLNEDQIISHVSKAIGEKLSSCSSSRTFYTQKTLLGTNVSLPSSESPSSTTAITTGMGSSKTGSLQSHGSPIKSSQQTPQNQLVRTDSRMRSMNEFFSPVSKFNTTSNSIDVVSIEDDDDDDDDDNLDFAPNSKATNNKRQRNEIELERNRGSDSHSQVSSSQPPKNKQQKSRSQKPILLTSIRTLTKDFEKLQHDGLTDIFKNFSFVGCVDDNLCLIQHSTKLYIVNICLITYRFSFPLEDL